MRSGFLFLLTSFAAWAQPGTKLAPELQELLAAENSPERRAQRQVKGEENRVDVIVVYKEGAGNAAMQRAKQGKGAPQLATPRSVINESMAAYRVAVNDLAQIAESDEVAEIHPDRELTASTYPVGPTVGLATARNLNLLGSGIGVAVLDTGKPDDGHFKNGSRNRIVHAQDFTGTQVLDLYGHSSHVMGIIGGAANAASIQMTFTQDWRGMAPAVNFVVMKVLDDTGAGRDSNVIAAIDRVIALRSTHNIRVMNLSLGRPVTVSWRNDLLCQAVERAWKAGIVVVVSAGNHGRLNNVGNRGYGTITAPGNSPFVITVGATRHMGTPDHRDDTLATYSSKGPTLIDWVAKPDLVAPGNQVVSFASAWDSTTDLWARFPITRIPSSMVFNEGWEGDDSWFYRLNGTSMAAPVVAGAAALMIQQDSTLTPDQVKARLMKTARKRVFPASSAITDGTTGQTFVVHHNALTIGAGYLDIGAALSNRDRATGNALSPTTRIVNNRIEVVWPAGSTFSVSNVVWGGSIVWGENVVWGSSIVWGENVVWGSGSLLWGSTIASGVNSLWGDNTTRAVSTFNVLIRGE